MQKKAIDKMLDRVMKDLYDGIQDFISENVDLNTLFRMAEGMKIPSMAANIPNFDAYKILGLDKSASNEEVKQRYNELLHKLHPDVSGVKGTEFITQLVVFAYDQIKKERGII